MHKPSGGRKDNNRSRRMLPDCAENADRDRKKDGVIGCGALAEALFNEINDLVYLISLDRTFIAVNPAASRITGWHPEECIGKKASYFIHPDDLPIADRRFENIVKGDKVALTELRILKKDGGYVPIEFNPAPLVKKNRIVGVIGIGRDISERKKAQEALEKSQSRFYGSHAKLMALMESTEDGILISDENGIPQLFNTAYARVMKEALNFEMKPGIQPHKLLDDPESVAYWDSLHRRVLGGDKFRAEFTYAFSESDIRHFEHSFCPIVRDGEVKGFTELTRDITPRKRVEEVLSESQERFYKAFHVNPSLMALTDMETGRLVDVNQAFVDSLGYSRESLLGTSTVQKGLWVNPEQRADMLDTILGQKSRGFHDIQLYTNEGEIRSYSVSGDIIELNGRPHLITVATDITERERMEKELLEAKAALEEKVENRTKDLYRANFYLKDYAKKLEMRNREFEEFAFAAAHDLREPLRKVRIFGSLLMQRFGSVLGKKGEEYLSRLFNSITRMDSLIKALMDYTRVMRNDEPFTSANLNDLVDEALVSLEDVIQQTEARIDVQALPSVEGNPSQIRQLFYNLVENALKFRGKKVPAVRIYADDSVGDFCRIKIEDNGIGFDDVYEEKIFRPFHHLHGKEDYSGVGIGLTICRKIVEHHGGNITVKSKKGAGAAFVIELPLKQKSLQE